MNPVERLLYEEVTHFIDRLSTSITPAGADAVRGSALRERLDDAELELAQARASMLEAYGRWHRAMDDVENLWALAAWRSTAAEEPGEKAEVLAA